MKVDLLQKAIFTAPIITRTLTVNEGSFHLGFSQWVRSIFSRLVPFRSDSSLDISPQRPLLRNPQTLFTDQSKRAKRCVCVKPSEKFGSPGPYR